MYACGAGEPIEGMSFFERMKQAGKSLVDTGAKTMLKVCQSCPCRTCTDSLGRPAHFFRCVVSTNGMEHDLLLSMELLSREFLRAMILLEVRMDVSKDYT
jgi:hypothetical protein